LRATRIAVEETERQLDAAWTAGAVEAAVAAWAIDRRFLPVDGLGRGLRDPYRAIRPLLPIGREGDAPFDLGPVEAWLRTWEMPAGS
jgi:hypothetical protein